MELLKILGPVIGTLIVAPIGLYLHRKSNENSRRQTNIAEWQTVAEDYKELRNAIVRVQKHCNRLISGFQSSDTEQISAHDVEIIKRATEHSDLLPVVKNFDSNRILEDRLKQSAERFAWTSSKLADAHQTTNFDRATFSKSFRMAIDPDNSLNQSRDATDELFSDVVSAAWSVVREIGLAKDANEEAERFLNLLNERARRFNPPQGALQ